LSTDKGIETLTHAAQTKDPKALYVLDKHVPRILREMFKQAEQGKKDIIKARKESPEVDTYFCIICLIYINQVIFYR